MRVKLSLIGCLFILLSCGKNEQQLPGGPGSSANPITNGNGIPVIDNAQVIGKSQAMSLIQFHRSDLLDFQVGTTFRSVETFVRSIDGLQCRFQRNLTKRVDRRLAFGGAEIQISGESLLLDTSSNCLNRFSSRQIINRTQRLMPSEIERLIGQISKYSNNELTLQQGFWRGKVVMVMRLDLPGRNLVRYIDLQSPVGLGTLFLQRTGNRGERTLYQNQI